MTKEDRDAIAYSHMLKTAKDNVFWLLSNPDGLVDMHGIKYWAGEVERLREILKKIN